MYESIQRERGIPNNTRHTNMIMFLEISRVGACARALRAYLYGKCNLSRMWDVFFSLFISYDGHRVAKRRGHRVGALAVAVAVGVAAVAGRKSRTRGELSESEANEPKAKRFQLAKW